MPQQACQLNSYKHAQPLTMATTLVFYRMLINKSQGVERQILSAVLPYARPVSIFRQKFYNLTTSLKFRLVSKTKQRWEFRCKYLSLFNSDWFVTLFRFGTSACVRRTATATDEQTERNLATQTADGLPSLVNLPRKAQLVILVRKRRFYFEVIDFSNVKCSAFRNTWTGRLWTM